MVLGEKNWWDSGIAKVCTLKMYHMYDKFYRIKFKLLEFLFYSFFPTFKDEKFHSN